VFEKKNLNNIDFTMELINLLECNIYLVVFMDYISSLDFCNSLWYSKAKIKKDSPIDLLKKRLAFGDIDINKYQW